MIMRADEEFLPWDELLGTLQELLVAAERGDCALIRQMLQKAVDGYTPQCELVDLVYNQKKFSMQKNVTL